jgi:acetyl-CoA carboxylase biotin carboxyl carrier protein
MDVFRKIKELVEMMKEFDLKEIEIKDGDKEIKLRKGRSGSEPEIVSVQQPVAIQQAPQPVTGTNPQAAPDVEAPPARDPNLIEFKSPMVGTFYRAPSPESPPYATEGDRVNKETLICIIEAMKVMNEIKSEYVGEIVEILVENGEAVEFGQPLFLIRATG